MVVTAHSAPAVNTIYFGLDVSKDSFDMASRPAKLATAKSDDVRSMKTCRFDRTQAGAAKFMQTAMEAAGKAQIIIVMEATGNLSKELAHWLWQAKPDIRIADVDPKRIHDWGRGIGMRAKTDQIDAAVIACYGPACEIKGDGKGDEIYEQLKALTRTRETFVANKQALQQQFKEATREHVNKAIARLMTAEYKRQIKSCEKSIGKLEEEIKKLIASQADLKEDFKLGDSIPGIGLITAATVFGEVGDMRRFNSRQLVAFAGLDPVTRQSGTSVRSPGRITRRGNTRIRRVLANAAWAATRTKKDNPFKSTYNRLIKRGKEPLVAINAVMRKMLVTLRGVLIAGDYTPEISTDLVCG